jgi:hypothetical protein
MIDLGSVWLLLRVALSPLLWQIGGVVFQTAYRLWTWGFGPLSPRLMLR